MEKTDKSLTKERLISMQVVDSNGRLVGKVKDVTFEIGKSGISLSIEKENGQLQTISWAEIQGASDFVVLKPVQQSNIQPEQQPVQPKQSNQQLCPTCGQPLTWIPEYKRWYCYNEKKYV